MKESSLNFQIINECRNKLILMKEDILNRIRGAKLEVSAQDKMSGDEIDQTVAQAIENEFAMKQNRLRFQLIEIETALAKIQRGEFGVCEETNEPIEAQRLLAIPYTRLSIEGAELREAMNKRFAR
jgi:DnaK suppressor protein